MERYLIVGLGNIGAEYARTRHNMGFMILDAFADASNIVFETQRYGNIAKTSFKGREIVLLKPSTYMNLSGNAVRYWMDKLNVPIERLLIICDDLNLPFGTLRMRKKGSDGGHNGLKNIQELIGTQNYARIRAGIGNDFNKGDQIDFVIGQFNTDEEDKIPSICEKATEGIKSFITIGPERTMSSFNAKNAE
ncbi:MAG: aminoacyl-tRNA hydrolase [Candidatus Cryptobacteroides sp.]